MRAALPFLSLAFATLAACGQSDPAPGKAAATKPAQIATVADPCGGPPGPVERSEAWMHAELVRMGHARSIVCGAVPSDPAADTLEGLNRQMAQADLYAAVMRDQLKLTDIMIAHQDEAIRAAGG